MRPTPVRLVAAAGVAAVVLGVVSTLALAALSGAFTRPGLYAAPYLGAAAGQSASALTSMDHRVDVGDTPRS